MTFLGDEVEPKGHSNKLIAFEVLKMNITDLK